MRPNGDHDGDDYGLPPTDIAIPDDARELEPDVIAYRRELRQQRRRRHWERVTGNLSRDGGATPFVAGALLIALASATVMTLLAAEPPTPGTPPGHPRPGAPILQQPATVGQPLPHGKITVSGRGDPTRQLSALRATLIALVPADCRCRRTLQWLIGEARRHQVGVYLVAAESPRADLRALAQRAGTSSPAPTTATTGPGRLPEARHPSGIDTVRVPAVRAAADTGGTLFSTYRPAGLTVLFVHSDNIVGYLRRHLRSDALLGSQFDRLHLPGAGTAYDQLHPPSRQSRTN